MHRAGRVTAGRFDPTVLGCSRTSASSARARCGAVSDRRRERARRSTGCGRRPAPSSSARAASALRERSRSTRAGSARASPCAGPAAASARAPARRSGLLLDAGGDIVAAGDGPPVRLADRDRGSGRRSARPAQGRSPSSSCDAGAVATSSVGVRHWQAPDGTEVHHLIDPVHPRAGADGPDRGDRRAADDPAWAEVWTKALFLAGRDGHPGRGARPRARGLVDRCRRAARHDARGAGADRVGRTRRASARRGPPGTPPIASSMAASSSAARRHRPRGRRPG